MKTTEIEVVIQCKYGGFSIDTEMALWLLENRGWLVTFDYDYDWSKKESYPINILFEQKVGDKNYYYAPHQDKFEFRSHKDLVDCIKALQEKHKDDSYPDSWYGHIRSFKIVNVSVYLEVEDYHDGKEKINCRIENASNED